MDLESQATLIAAFITTIGAILLWIWQANHEMNVRQQQRFDDAIGNEQRVIENIAVRARLLIMKMADDPDYQPNDSEIEDELFRDILSGSNITHLSHELNSISINGKMYARKVVHGCRAYFLEKCIEVRDIQKSGQPLDADGSLKDIKCKTICAAGEAGEVSRAVRDRRRLWYALWLTPSPYHSRWNVRSRLKNEADKQSQIPDDAQPADIQTS